jgi:hypothetical protein
MFEILDRFNPKWDNLVKEYDLDVYFTPQYCGVWEEYGDGKANLFFYESNFGVVLYPFLVRRINNLEFLKGGQLIKDLYDITTPYGYGGPIFFKYDKQKLLLLVKGFRQDFAEYTRRKNIISEFIRFHHMYENYRPFINSDIKCKFIRNTVAIDLTLEPERILMAMSQSTRNEIRQAVKNGLNVVFKEKPAPNDLKIFYEIYLETMERLKSSNYYKFSFDFFLNTFNLLKEKAELVFVYKDGQLLSSAIFLLSDNISHYHLSGSLHQYLPLRPNNIMLYQAAIRYKLMGKKYLHLGGGYKGNDSLFSFKRGFNKNGLLDFYIGSRVFDEKVYNEIVRKWKEESHLGKDFQSDFFPLYRLNIEGDE